MQDVSSRRNCLWGKGICENSLYYLLKNLYVDQIWQNSSKAKQTVVYLRGIYKEELNFGTKRKRIVEIKGGCSIYCSYHQL